MNDFSMEVALIWARANASASVDLGPLEFAKSVAAVAAEVQRLSGLTGAAAEGLESKSVELSAGPEPLIWPNEPHVATPAETARVGA